MLRASRKMTFENDLWKLSNGISEGKAGGGVHATILGFRDFRTFIFLLKLATKARNVALIN